MTTTMDSRYETLAAQFQYQQIAMLKAALDKHGIAPELALEICGDFTFDLSIFFDQGEIELDGQAFRPTVAFTADEENFLVQPDDVEYHLHAFNSTQEVFGNPNEPSEPTAA
ncbi:MAG: hypothetical protein WB821_02570 [Burkholderiaceae bacterium]